MRIAVSLFVLAAIFRFTLTTGICSTLNTTAPLKSKGTVIFLRASGHQSDSKADVMEKNLSTGRIKTIISHKSLPKGFKTRISSATPSPDGKYLHIVGSSGWVFKDKATGKIRTIFGESFSYGGEEEPSGAINSSDWCWDRERAILTRISPPAEAAGYGWTSSDSPAVWSPKGNRLLIKRDFQEAPYTNWVYIYDAKTRSVRTISTGAIDLAVWSGTGSGVIESKYTEGNGSIVSYAGAGVKTKELFKWPREISSIAQSPDGSILAVFDLSACYLLKINGRLISKLRVPVQEETFSVTFQFNTSGTCLAAFTSYSYGEPHIGLAQQLWVTDIKSMKTHKIANWNETFQGSDLATDRWILGWLPDQKTFAICGSIDYGAEKPADSANDWIKIWTYNSDLRASKGTQIYDSGKGCLGATWYPGE